jgi:hypothetical protein
MSNSRKRDGRYLTDAEVEAADEWHWTSIGEACDRLLERLTKHHKRKRTQPPSRVRLKGAAEGPRPPDDQPSPKDLPS